VGVVRKILGIRQVDPVSTLYSGYAAIEMSESIHLHWRNTRVEFDRAEFDVFCRMAARAYLAWLNHGKPATFPAGQIVYLGAAQLDPVPSRENPAISSNEMRVEVQQWADYIHVHWKWLRLELTFDEFVEFAGVMAQSLEGLKAEAWFTQSPRRVGKNHRAVPHGLVDGGPANGFWVRREDAHDWIGYESYYLDGHDKVFKQSLERDRRDAAVASRPAGRWFLSRGLFEGTLLREFAKLFLPMAVLTAYRRIRARLKSA